MTCLQFLRKNHYNIPDIKFVHAIFKMMHVLKLNHSLQNKCKIIYCFQDQNITLDWKLLQHRSFSNFFFKLKKLFFFTISGLNMGITLFIVDYVYYKFPRVKRKYDSVYKLWWTLPTRVQWEMTHIESHIDNVSQLVIQHL